MGSLDIYQRFKKEFSCLFEEINAVHNEELYKLQKLEGIGLMYISCSFVLNGQTMYLCARFKSSYVDVERWVLESFQYGAEGIPQSENVYIRCDSKTEHQMFSLLKEKLMERKMQYLFQKTHLVYVGDITRKLTRNVIKRGGILDKTKMLKFLQNQTETDTLEQLELVLKTTEFTTSMFEKYKDEFYFISRYTGNTKKEFQCKWYELIEE